MQAGHLRACALLECSIVDSFEVFVADDALEGGATTKRHIFDACGLIG